MRIIHQDILVQHIVPGFSGRNLGLRKAARPYGYKRPKQELKWRSLSWAKEDFEYIVWIFFKILI